MKSYNTCIAQRIELNGQVVYILNRHSFSPSTNKHQSAAYSAVPEGAMKFCIDLENWGASEIIYQNRWKDDWKETVCSESVLVYASSSQNCMTV